VTILDISTGGGMATLPAYVIDASAAATGIRRHRNLKIIKARKARRRIDSIAQYLNASRYRHRTALCWKR